MHEHCGSCHFFVCYCLSMRQIAVWMFFFTIHHEMFSSLPFFFCRYLLLIAILALNCLQSVVYKFSYFGTTYNLSLGICCIAVVWSSNKKYTQNKYRVMMRSSYLKFYHLFTISLESSIYLIKIKDSDKISWTSS